jgi:predicted signal transduction protein with EAL and GGDEF domain
LSKSNNRVAEPYEWNGHSMTIGASIGIVMVPRDGDDPDELMRHADLALYGAKEDGRGCYRFFAADMNAKMQARRTLELELRQAVAGEEFAVYYQPLMDIETRGVVGFEALLRWNHPTRGLLAPDLFLPLAEEIGAIVPIGLWVLRQACRDAAGWPETTKVAVNLSANQFASPSLVADVIAALADGPLPAARLELEITETIMLADTDEVLVKLHQLRALGIGIAMDDFGTGYSSLNYLRRFPFDKVKIDRSFINELGRGGDCDSIVAAMTELCKQMHITTLAEGVQTEAQMAQLRARQCNQAQGYLFSQPRPASEIAGLCRSLAEQARSGAGGTGA